MLIMLLIAALLASLNIYTVGSTHTKLFLDYFSYRDVNIVCVLNCYTHNLWSKKLVTYASYNSIAVLKVNIDIEDNINLNKCLDQKMSSIGVILDWSCTKSKDALYYASENMLLDASHKWIIIDESTNDSITFNKTEANSYVNEENITITKEINEILSNVNISVDADIIVATKISSSEYVLQDVYNYGKIQGGELIVKKVGIWSTQTGLDLNINGYKYYRRWDFQQWSMRMIVVISPVPTSFDSKILTDRSTASNVATIMKTSATIIHEIAEIHNFRFIYTVTDRWISDFNRNSSRHFIDLLYGDWNNTFIDETFKVVANALYFREQDISPVIRFLESIHEKIDILHPPLTYVETKYYYRIPTFGPGRYENEFFRPFSFGAWLMFLGVSTLCAVTLLVTAAFEKRLFIIQYAVFSVIASVCQQFFQDADDIVSSRTSTARKLTILVTGISCVLIYNYYTSSVVSWLLNGPPPSITSLEELLNSPLDLIFEDIGYTRSWLQTSSYYYNKRNAKIEDALRHNKVLNKKKGAPLLVPLDVGIAMVKAGGYAYHTEINSANEIISKTFTQTELCEIGSLQSMEKTQIYPCLQKNSPYKEFYTWSLMRLLERGIISCIQRRTSFYSVRCKGSSPRALALGGAAPAFTLLAAGFALATVFMISERLIYKLNVKKNARAPVKSRMCY